MSIDDWMLDRNNNYFIEPEDNESLVCKDCINDLHIINNLDTSFFQDECSFCKLEVNVVETVDFFDQIVDAIKSDGWVFANDEGSYNGAEGGWKHDTTEVCDVAYNILSESNVGNELIDFSIQHFSNELMIDKPYGQDYFDNDYHHDWDKFKQQVKHNTRYTTFLKTKNANYIKRFKKLMAYISTNAIDSIHESTILYRGRIFNDAQKSIDPLSYGPPDIKDTVNSRMTPKGISGLYCSSAIRTVIKELKPNNPHTIGIIRIKPKASMKIIDLTSIHTPCPFDIDNRQYRRALDFLKEFESEISKPILVDEAEHLEYMPTQVIFEYLKHIFKNSGFAGIKYNSSKNNENDNGVNYAFFCGPEEFQQLFNIRPRRVKILLIKTS